MKTKIKLLQLHLASSLIYSLQLGFPPSFWANPIISWSVWSNGKPTRVLAPKICLSNLTLITWIGEKHLMQRVMGRCRGWGGDNWVASGGGGDKTRWFWVEVVWEGRDKQGWFCFWGCWPKSTGLGSKVGVDWAEVTLGLGGLVFVTGFSLDWNWILVLV